MHPSTRVVHGTTPIPDNGVMPAIQLSTTFTQPCEGGENEFVYQRGNNPTRQAAEHSLAVLEDAQHAVSFATGLAAITAVFSRIIPGQKVLFSRSVYGGTYRYAHTYFTRQGIDFSFFNTPSDLTNEDLEKVALIFIETPINPTLEVVDIPALAHIAHSHDALLAVDNTFLTALLQRPLDLGADFSVYSATKYLGGHSDVLAGAVLTNSDPLAEDLRLNQNTYGSGLSPFDAYSLIRGIKTLSVRLERQEKNTRALIKFLLTRPEITALYYPGSASEKQKKIQEGQSSGIGAVISFELSPQLSHEKFLRALGFIGYAVSLGGVETLICNPATMTHDSFSSEDRLKAGIKDNLYRLSVGIEDINDLIEQFTNAFAVSHLQSQGK